MKKRLFLFCFIFVLVKLTTAQSLIAYYPFNGDANDASGNNYNGTLHGNATANDTLEIGDNNTDYVSLPSTLLSGLDDLTMTFQVKFNSLHTAGQFPGNTILHAWGGSFNEDDLKISQNQNSSVFQVSVKTNQPTFTFIAEDDKWYCFAIVRENNQITLYIDGLQVGNTSSAGNGSLTPTTNGIVLGQEEDCDGGCFVQNQSLYGKLDELKVYDYAFTANEAASKCTTCGDKLFYPFSVNASDSSGNLFNGTLYANAMVDNGILSTGDNDLDYVAVPSGALDGIGNFDVSFGATFDTIHTSGSFPGNTVIHAWGANQDELKITLDGVSGKFHISVHGSQNNFEYFPEQSEWNCYHVQRKNDSLFLYVNSLFIGLAIVPADPLDVYSEGIVIGQEEDCLGGCFAQNQSLAGALDNFKISNCPVPVPKNEKCDYPLAVNETPKGKFSVYPNPADGFVYVNSPNEKNLKIELVSPEGISLPIRMEQADFTERIITDDLPNGIYVLRFLNAQKIIAYRKIVIIH